MKTNYKTINIVFLAILMQNSLYSQDINDIAKIKKATDVESAKKFEEKHLQFRKSQEKLIKEYLLKNPSFRMKANSGNENTSKIIQIEDGVPFFYVTTGHNITDSRTSYLQTGGGLNANVNGENMMMYIWDNGHVNGEHKEFKENEISRVSYPDVTENQALSTEKHATQVAGVLGSQGLDPEAKGMLPKANIKSYTWYNDIAEVSLAARENGLLVSNHSYILLPGGVSLENQGKYTGRYDGMAQSFDEISYNSPYYLHVRAAGNDGNIEVTNAPLDGEKGYDKLLSVANSKNSLTVGYAQNINIDANGNFVSAEIAPKSSQGPSDDYRIKPDLVGSGSWIKSTTNINNYEYTYASGTSLSSPNVSGTLLLLQQYYKKITNNFMRAATLKGLALHTADDMGATGPDAISGWGLLNAKKAGEFIKNRNSLTDNTSIIDEKTLYQNGSNSFTVRAVADKTLTVSISWTDPAGVSTSNVNDTTPKLINDLDVRVTKQDGTTHYPWRLTSVKANDKGDNIRDPFEKIEIPNASGKYTITVKHKGNLKNDKQNYSIIVSGLDATPICEIPAISNLSAIKIADTSIILKWDGDASAKSYNIFYKLSSRTNWQSYETTETSINVLGLIPNTSFDFFVTAKCANNIYSPPSTSIKVKTLAKSSKMANIENIKASSFDIYPNPSNGQMNIAMTIENESEISVKVFSKSGRLVLDKKISAKNTNGVLALNLQELQEGNYLLSIENAGNKTVKEIMIKK